MKKIQIVIISMCIALEASCNAMKTEPIVFMSRPDCSQEVAGASNCITECEAVMVNGTRLRDKPLPIVVHNDSVQLKAYIVTHTPVPEWSFGTSTASYCTVAQWYQVSTLKYFVVTALYPSEHPKQFPERRCTVASTFKERITGPDLCGTLTTFINRLKGCHVVVNGLVIPDNKPKKITTFGGYLVVDLCQNKPGLRYIFKTNENSIKLDRFTVTAAFNGILNASGDTQLLHNEQLTNLDPHQSTSEKFTN